MFRMPQYEMDYRFFAPTRILFGWGKIVRLGELAAAVGRRALVVTGGRHLQTSGIWDELQSILARGGVTSVHLGTVAREPRVADVDSLVAQAKQLPIKTGDFLLAIGGGAVLDTAKAVAGLAADPQQASIADYLENVGRGLKLQGEPLPLVTIPTTAGTGAEVTKNAVISSVDPPFKKSFRDERLIAKAALIDPELTVSCPVDVTAASGMDAITQLVESFITQRAAPIPAALVLSSLPNALRALPRAVEAPGDRDARTAMSHAAMLSGICLANAGLGMAHGVAAALGVHCQVRHGLACAMMLPVALWANRPVCEERLATLARAAGLVEADTADAEAAEHFIQGIEQLRNRLGLPRRLSELGVTAEQLPAIAQSSYGNSMNGNPRRLEPDELIEILSGVL